MRISIESFTIKYDNKHSIVTLDCRRRIADPKCRVQTQERIEPQKRLTVHNGQHLRREGTIGSFLPAISSTSIQLLLWQYLGGNVNSRKSHQ